MDIDSMIMDFVNETKFDAKDDMTAIFESGSGESVEVKPVDEATYDKCMAIIESMDPELYGLIKFNEAFNISNYIAPKMYNDSELKEQLKKLEDTKTPPKILDLFMRGIMLAAMVTALGVGVYSGGQALANNGFGALGAGVMQALNKIGLGTLVFTALKYGAPWIDWIVTKFYGALRGNAYVSFEDKQAMMARLIKGIDKSIAIAAKRKDNKFVQKLSETRDKLEYEMQNLRNVI